MSGKTFPAGDRAQAAPELTADQIRLLRMIADGLPVKQIGRLMGVTPDTAQKRIEVLRRRLAARTNGHLVHRAYELGLLVVDPMVRRVARPEPVRRVVAVPRLGPLTSKSGADAAGAREVAHMLEAGFKGAQQ
jgi:DNA-binding CsgD family transcriptional regulator